MTRRLRLWSGLVMLAYVTMHLSNHAMGLISLRAMNSVLGWVLWVWGNPPAQVLLYGAFLVHFTLALWALWERRTLRLNIGELTQVVLGFACRSCLPDMSSAPACRTTSSAPPITITRMFYGPCSSTRRGTAHCR